MQENFNIFLHYNFTPPLPLFLKMQKMYLYMHQSNKLSKWPNNELLNAWLCDTWIV